MKPNLLQIIHEPDKIIIKKKLSTMGYIIIATLYLIGIILLIILGFCQKFPEFWIPLVIMATAGFIVVMSLSGKIVVDLHKKEIHLYWFFKETYHFDEIKDLQCYIDNSGEASIDDGNLLLILKSGRKVDFGTTGEQQTQEIIALLTPILFETESLSAQK